MQLLQPTRVRAFGTVSCVPYVCAPGVQDDGRLHAALLRLCVASKSYDKVLQGWVLTAGEHT